MDDAGPAGYCDAGHGTIQPADERYSRNHSTNVVRETERIGAAGDDCEDGEPEVGEGGKVGSNREGLGRAADIVQLYCIRIEVVRLNGLRGWQAARDARDLSAKKSQELVREH